MEHSLSDGTAAVPVTHSLEESLEMRDPLPMGSRAWLDEWTFSRSWFSLHRGHRGSRLRRGLRVFPLRFLVGYLSPLSGLHL